MRTGGLSVLTARFLQPLPPRNGLATLHITARRHVCAALPGTRSSGRRLQLAFAPVAVVHAELWRTFFVDPYQRSWYNERNDRGSISLAPLGRGCVIRMPSPPKAARCVPGSNKSRLFSDLRKTLYSRIRIIVRSLDRHTQVLPPHSVMHTPVNFQVWHVHRARDSGATPFSLSRHIDRRQPGLELRDIASNNEIAVDDNTFEPQKPPPVASGLRH